MILVVAFLAIGAALLFMLWPMIRHLEPPAEGGPVAPDRARQSALLAIEEIELDHASGRLSSIQAQARRAEAMLHADLVLQEGRQMTAEEAEDHR